MKKIIIMILVMLFVVLSCNITGLCAEEYNYENFTYTIRGGKITVTGYYGDEAGALIIPEEINGYPVTAIESSAFNFCSKITEVTLPKSITTVYGGSFQNSSVKKVVFEGSLESIPTSYFYNCTKLEEVVLPTGLTTIGNNAFSQCTSLKKINLSEGIQTIGDSAFFACSKLDNIAIPQSINLIGTNAFRSCTSAKTIILPDKAIDIENNAFENTGYYNDEANWDNGILYLDNVLIKADSELSGDVVVRDGVKAVASYAFYSCNNLKKVTLPQSMIQIGEFAFLSASFSSLEIPDTIQTIRADAFYDSSYYNNSENWINGALYIGNHLIKTNTDIDEDFVIKDGTVTIAESAFYSSRRQMTTVTLPNSLKVIGSKAFAGCSKLTDVYYNGRRARWNEVIIGDKNEELLSATLHVCAEPEITSVVDYEGGISITLNGVEAGGEVVIILKWNDSIEKVVTAIPQGTINYPTDVIYNKVKVMWIESLESLQPACEAKCIDVDYVSNKKIMTVIKTVERVAGYEIHCMSEGEELRLSVDAENDPEVLNIVTGNIVAYSLESTNVATNLEVVFESTRDVFNPEDGASLIVDNSTEHVIFGLAEHGSDYITIDGIKYTTNDDTNYLLMKYGNGNIYYGVGKRIEMKNEYVLIRVKDDNPTVICDAIIFQELK